MEIEADLTKLNHSELVVLAQWANIEGVSRAIPREKLIEALYSSEKFSFTNPLDEKRKRLSSWLKRHWDRLQMQASKSTCPDCYSCRDIQVLDCYQHNKHHFISVKK